MFNKQEIQTIYDALCYYSRKQELMYDKEVSDNVDCLIGKTLSIMETDHQNEEEAQT